MENRSVNTRVEAVNSCTGIEHAERNVFPHSNKDPKEEEISVISLVLVKNISSEIVHVHLLVLSLILREEKP